MRKYLQYLVGSQKIHYLQHQPQLLQKKYVAEELKDYSCLILNEDNKRIVEDQVNGKSIKRNGFRPGEGVPFVKTEYMANEVYILSYDSRVATESLKEQTSQYVKNILFTNELHKQLKSDILTFFEDGEYSNKKAKYYIIFPKEWFRYIKLLRPKSKSPMPNFTRYSESDTRLYSPSSDSSDKEVDMKHWSTISCIEKVATINLENELFRKPCSSFFLPHSATLFIVTSIGIEAYEIPDVGAYLAAIRLDKSEVGSKFSNETMNEKTKTDSNSNSSTSSNTSKALSDKKSQKRLWVCIHVDLSHSTFKDTIKALTIHICACLIHDRNLVACGDSDGYIRIYSLQNKGKLAFTLPMKLSSIEKAPQVDNIFYHPHNGPIVDLSFISHSDELISAGIDGSCRVWNVKKQRLSRIILPPSAVATCIKYLNSKPELGFDLKAAKRILPKVSSSLGHNIDKLIPPITSIDTDSHTNTITVGYLTGEIAQFKIETGERILAIGNSSDKQIVKTLAVLSQSQFLLFANDNQIVRIWDILLEREHSRFICNASQKLLYIPSRDILFLCTESGEILVQKGVVVDILTKERKLQQIYTLKPHTSSIISIWYHDDCDMLITMSSNGQVSISLDVVTASLLGSHHDVKHKYYLMEHFFKYNQQISTMTEDNKRELLKELYSFPSEDVSSIIGSDIEGEELNEKNFKEIFPLTDREIATFSIVYEYLKMQVRLHPQNDYFRKTLESIEKDRIMIQKSIVLEYIDAMEFLRGNCFILKNKFIDFIDPNRVKQTNEIIHSNFCSERDEMLKRHAIELEELRQRHEMEMKEFETRKNQESTNAARALLTVKLANKERVRSLDLEGAKTYKKLLNSLEICPIQNISGLDPTKYKVLSLLSETSVVVEAISFALQELVVIKVYPPGIPLCEQLKNCRLVKVYEHVWTDTHTLVVMEKMHSNLSQFLQIDGGFLKKFTIQQIVYDILCALEYLHEQGMVHRDISPKNIFLDTHVRAFLKHFGIMKRIEYEQPENGVWYSAPELFKNSISFASDVWSVGIVFGYLLQTEQERQDFPIIHGSDRIAVLQSIAEMSCATKSDINAVGNGHPLFTILEPSTNQNPYLKKISCASEIEVTLLNSMLKFDPQKRASISELKKHVYFKAIRNQVRM